MRAWLFQDSRQKKKLGAANCPWSVGWLDPEGRRCSKRIGSKSQAEKFRRKIEGELAAGTYEMVKRASWSDFRIQYESDELSTKAPATRQEASTALDHFQRIAKPKLIRNINTAIIDAFKAKRLQERGKKRGSTVSPATVNKELRHLRAALAKSEKWGYLAKLPSFEKLK